MKNTYTIKETNENPKLAVITRPGKEVVFTLEEVEQHVEKLKKLKTECEGTIEIAESKMKNIQDHHPDVVAMNPETRFAAYLYEQFRLQSDPYKEKLDEVNRALAEYDEDLAEIYEQHPELKPND